MVDGHGTDSNGGSEPPASAWPLITAVVAILLGVVLLWWWNDEGSNLTQPVLGASIVIGVIALGAWLFEEISQRKRSQRYGAAGDARKTQVITFGIAEGKYEDAESGVLAALNLADEKLRKARGFEDIRVVASKSDSGVSQAIVETTWSSANEISAYEATRSTMLDLLNGYPDEVVAGSVQAFDMDVVRDTKDVFVRMGFGPATTLFVSILVGGLAVGAVIGVTSDDAVASGEPDTGSENGGEPAAPATSIELIVTRTAFEEETITAAAGQEFTVNFINDDALAPHNIMFFTEEGGELLSEDSATAVVVASGAAEEITFVAPAPGTYFFICTIHPTEMTGDFITK